MRPPPSPEPGATVSIVRMPKLCHRRRPARRAREAHAVCPHMTRRAPAQLRTTRLAGRGRHRAAAINGVTCASATGSEIHLPESIGGSGVALSEVKIFIVPGFDVGNAALVATN